MLDTLRNAEPLLGRQDVLRRPSPVPAEPGIYAWYMRGLPAPTDSCHQRAGHALVYLGIAPSRANSGATLRSRIRQHLNGNASGSTLRLSVGSLLAEELGISLRRVGRRLHFGEGEATLNSWLDQCARVCWLPHLKPWEVEAELIQSCDLPLNLEHNANHPFRPTLSAMRAAARAEARSA